MMQETKIIFSSTVEVRQFISPCVCCLPLGNENELNLSCLATHFQDRPRKARGEKVHCPLKSSFFFRFLYVHKVCVDSSKTLESLSLTFTANGKRQK